MKIYTLTIKDSYLDTPASGQTVCAAGSHNAVRFNLTFNTAWAGKTKRVAFQTPSAKLAIPVQTDTDGEYVLIHHDLAQAAGSLYFSVIGGELDGDELLEEIATLENFVVIGPAVTDEDAYAPEEVQDLINTTLVVRDQATQAAALIAGVPAAEAIREENEEGRVIAEQDRVTEFNGMVGDLENINTILAAIVGGV